MWKMHSHHSGGVHVGTLALILLTYQDCKIDRHDVLPKGKLCSKKLKYPLPE